MSAIARSPSSPDSQGLPKKKKQSVTSQRYLLAVWLIATFGLIANLAFQWQNNQQLFEQRLDFTHQLYLDRFLYSANNADKLQQPLANEPGAIALFVSPDGLLLKADPEQPGLQHLLGEEIPLRMLSPIQNNASTKTVIALPDVASDQTRLARVSVLPGDNTFMVVSLPEALRTNAFIQRSAYDIAIWALLTLAVVLIFANMKKHLHRTKTREETYLKALNKAEQRSALLMNNIPGCAYKINYPHHRIMLTTSGCKDILGEDSQELINHKKTMLDFIHPDERQKYLKEIEYHVQSQTSFELIYRIVLDNQDFRWVMNRGQIVVEKDRQLTIEGLLLDVTDHKLSQQQVEYLATRDPLTELANRYFFNDELIRQLHSDNVQELSFALLFIDLDRFKTINDSLGHQVGDKLLKQAADRLKTIQDKNHLVARLGGDEFIVMLKDPDSKREITELADNIIRTLNQVYQVEYNRLNTSCSIGISLFPQDSSDPHELIRHADTAMYKAKDKGGNCYEFFTDEMNHQANTRLSLENDLRKAIQNQEFELYYQPQVATQDNQLLGAEALIRWRHPTQGQISPADFIPIAEETGLIKEIGKWALMEACSTFSSWNKAYGLDLKIAVNVSVRQLDDLFVAQVQDTLNKTRIDPSNLELEITESLLMNNVKGYIELLERIKRQGINFAMDDFGTGYSSLSYLKQFPISKLKIDREFIREINNDQDDAAIVRAIIAMAKTLNLGIVAEGIENIDQLSLLQDLNCDSYQGFYFSRPLPKDDFFTQYIEPEKSMTMPERAIN